MDRAGQEGHRASIDRADLTRIALVGLTAALLWPGRGNAIGRARLLGFAATLVAGYPIFKKAFENLIDRRMTMELSMAIALAAALVIGETFTALLITGFVLAAEVLEDLAVSRGRRAIGQLLEFLPRRVRVRADGEFVDTALDQLSTGDLVLVLPGGRIPVDGVVAEGESFVDQAAITGESVPLHKVSGSQVFAGTMNQSGALEIRSERVGRDTTLVRSWTPWSTQNTSCADSEDRRSSSRIPGVYRPGRGGLAFIVTRDVRSTIAVIIVAGACGVAAGTPLAILGAIGRAARSGVIIKGGIYLEALWSIDTVVLDKTGTLTFGGVRVSAVYPAAKISVREVVEAAAIAECRSEHPIGRAIIKYAEERRIPRRQPTHFRRHQVRASARCTAAKRFSWATAPL